MRQEQTEADATADREAKSWEADLSPATDTIGPSGEQESFLTVHAGAAFEYITGKEAPLTPTAAPEAGFPSEEQTEPDTGVDTEVDTEADTEIDTEADTEAEVLPKSETEAASIPEAGPEPEEPEG